MRYHDIQKLKDAGYKVVQRSPWHFQVECNRTVVNIWPSKRKYMVQYGSGADYYRDVVAAVESLVGKPNEESNKTWPEILYERYYKPPTLEQQIAERQWREGLEMLMVEIYGI